MHRTVPIPSLAEAGLNLQAVFSIEHLPQTLQQALTPLIPNTPSYPYLLLLAHAGTQLWTALQTAHIDLTDHTTNPIDTYTQETIATYFRQQHPQHQYHLLYPQYQATPLMPLGQLAGWSHPTPLGLGIHPHYGLWYAYRAALVTTAPLPLTSPNTAPSPCLTCHHKPCLTACPPQATHPTHFDWQTCATYRLQPHSPCASRCLARLACPHAPQHRYPPTQIKYHYQHSLATIKQFF